MKNYIGISRDHSGSMQSIARYAARDYNNLVAKFETASKDRGIDTIVSVVKCGVGYSGTVVRDVVFSSVSVLKPLAEFGYEATGGSTPLWDSVGELITIMENAPDAADPEVSFVVMIVTDGQENSSRRWSASSLMNKIRALQSTDRWTFVFRVPRGASGQLERFGIPRGNILEWDQTQQGVEAASQLTQEAIDQFYEGRTRGLRSTANFYTTDLTGVTNRTLQSKMTDVSRDVLFWDVNSDAQIRPFVEGKLGRTMVKGGAFYQLMKKEDEVQDYKMICIRDKKTGAVYTGVEARNVLGLPHHGTVKVAPGVHGNYDIFIQSTSVNRRLVAGTQVMYWERVGQPYSAPSTLAPQKPVTPTKSVVKRPIVPTANTHPSDDYIRGYKDGFPAGKAKGPERVFVVVDNYAKGYASGYKDGRGKQKRLYK